MAHVPSPQQQTYYDWIVNESGSCVLEAVAGAGKTTTLIEGLKLMSGTKFFGAYNKKIAEEIAQRTNGIADLTVSTMHAAGFKAWRRVARDVKVENKKCRNIFREAAARNPQAQYAAFETPVLQLVSYAKQAGLGVLKSMDDSSEWYALADHFDVDMVGADDLVIKLARKTLQASIGANMKEIDFDDMIYAPLVGKVRAYEYDWVLIDEAQDTNATRRALSLLMLKRGGRLVAVGDRHQAIYGFTGADNDALDLIGNAVSAKRLPLTVTYRCPKSVVKYAQSWVKHIEAHESAPEGSVITATGQDTLHSLAKPGDAILCRFNAPIIEAVYSFIAAGIPAKVEGREIGEGLKTLARRWKSSTTFSKLYDNLDKYLERETSKYRAKEEETKAAAVEDKVNCLRVIAQRVEKIDPKPTALVDRVCTEIDTIFSDVVGAECVLLSTIHKSKGREWNRVVWLQTGPSKWARKQWELEQEANLCYVAATRAKSELVLADVELVMARKAPAKANGWNAAEGQSFSAQLSH